MVAAVVVVAIASFDEKGCVQIWSNNELVETRVEGASIFLSRTPLIGRSLGNKRRSKWFISMVHNQKKPLLKLVKLTPACIWVVLWTIACPGAIGRWMQSPSPTARASKNVPPRTKEDGMPSCELILLWDLMYIPHATTTSSKAICVIVFVCIQGDVYRINSAILMLEQMTSKVSAW